MKKLPTLLPARELVASLALALFLAAGCGGSTEEPTAPLVQRLELEPVGEAVSVPESRVLADWREFDESENFTEWELRTTNTKVLPFNDQRVLRVNRTEGAVIGIPAELTFEAAGEVEIELIVQSMPYSLTVRLLDGEREVQRQVLRIPSYKAEQQALFKFPSDLREAWSIDRIELVLPPGEEPTGLSSITVRDVPLGTYFPEGACEGLELVDLDGDARRARVLGNSSALRTSFRVDDLGQELRFSYALPVDVRLFGQLPELYLTLRFAEGGEEVFAFELDESTDEPARWHRAAIELDEWIGKSVTATFELRTQDNRPGMCALGRPWLAEAGDDVRTVLLVTSDTHRADHVGFLSRQGAPRTATIDRLASAGVVFSDAFSSINNTTPSHVALFTGLSPRDTGLVANAHPLGEEAPTLAECFRDLGYVTLAAVSAAPVNHDFSGLGQGFDRYSSPGLRSARSSVDTLAQLEEWLPEFEGQPLFVWLHIYDAHGPYRPPAEYWRPYYPGGADPYDAARPGADPSLAPYWDRAIADPAYTEALYKGEITFLDERLGEFLALERFWNGTIAFTADHGEDLRYGERPFDHRGLSLGTLAVPLIFKSPRLPAGVRRREPVLMIDVGRTLLNLAGHPEAAFPGRDLFDEGDRIEGPRFALEANGTGASVQLGRWMLVLPLRHSAPDPWQPEEEFRDRFHEPQLFDLELDPSCVSNVGAEHRDETARLRGLLIRWLTESEPRAWQNPEAALGSDAARHLADLGYVSTSESGSTDQWIDPDCGCKWCREFE